MDKDPIFEVGQIVIARSSYPWRLTEGHLYTVVEYIPTEYSPHFTWPAYVAIVDDSGKLATFHAYRFRELTEEEQKSYK